MNGASFVLANAILLLVGLTAWTLTSKAERRTALAFVLVGLVAAAVKIAIWQQTPQWRDINPDSITYELNGRAFAAHWQGRAVAAEEYNLRGLIWHGGGLHGLVWAPNDRRSYASIIGSHEWLYAAYVGLWFWLADASQPLVIWTNALWAAFFPAAAFGIALALAAPRRVALVAGILAVFDPSAGVNASWLLKDTLAGFLAMAALWALAGYLHDGGWGRLVVATPALGFLGGARYVAFLGLVMAVSIISVGGFVRRAHRQAFALLLVVAGACVSFGGLYAAPQSIAPPQSILAAKGAGDTLRAWRGDDAADDSVLRWKSALAENLPLAAVKSVAHTLFAPYPWVAIHPGLTWRAFSELYYPGVLLWMLCLPGIFWATAERLRRGGPAAWLVLLFLASQLAAYTIWYGEWSTRQRVFALPAFFALAAIGWQGLFAWWEARGGVLRQAA